MVLINNLKAKNVTFFSPNPLTLRLKVIIYLLDLLLFLYF